MTPDDNATLLRRAIEAFNRDGIEGALPYYHPDVEQEMDEGWLEDPVYRGHDGARRLLEMFTAHFDEYRWELEEIVEAGGSRLAARILQRGRLKGDGSWVSQPVAVVVHVRAARVERVRYFFDWADALRALDEH